MVFSLSLYLLHNQPTYGKDLKRDRIIKGKSKRQVALQFCLSVTSIIIITIIIIIIIDNLFYVDLFYKANQSQPIKNK